VVLALVVLSISATAVARSGPSFRFEQPLGPHPIGVRVADVRDESTALREGRVLQTLAWYPASDRRAKPIAFQDYAKLSAPAASFVSAAPAPGHFPIVVYAPSFSEESWENADLCVYLASHGYLVLASASRGESQRAMTKDLAGIDAQARDIVALVSYAQTLPSTDARRVAVVGFSWGGIANLFAANRDERIKALVALDGSMRYFPGLVREGGVHPETLKIPLMYVAQARLTLEDRERYFTRAELEGPNVLDAWTQGDLVLAYMMRLAHKGFSAKFQRDERTWAEVPEPWRAEYTREDGIVGYAWVARYTLAFLDAYLKQDRAALAFLRNSPAENAVPPHTMAVIFRAASRSTAH
jgi:dienelactone hydrolase